MNADDIELLSAYMDQELAEESKARLEERLSREPELRKLLQTLRQQELYLKASVTSIETKPIKPELLELINQPSANDGSAQILTFPIKKVRRAAFASASFAFLAFFAWTGLGIFNVSELTEGKVQITGALIEITAGEEKQSGDIIIRETLAFERTDGALCKLYEKQNAGVAHQGLACLKNNKWDFPIEETQTNLSDGEAYLPASGDVSGDLHAYIESNIKGIPLAKEDEIKLMENNR